jgi:hypothetical protein
MSEFKHRPNSGSLFLNKKRDANNPAQAKWATHEGDIDIECPHCSKSFGAFLSAWVKETKTGSRFFSLALKAKTGKRPDAQAPLGDKSKPKDAQSGFNDEVPF